ncbi:DUF6326 family protein [Pedobacter jeongneungensis]|uniref:DUF6326 family protein n=1 Tax=Pedobacter jeongneungensis TaxID=947309 RepID=UPI00046821AC|nr:DUF6326 family protein [Pedobacter jeongneungensis]
MNNLNKPAFKDFEINPKIKLSALWTAVTLCYLYGDYFELYVPHKAEGLINGDNLLNSPVKLFSAAVLLAIPALMVLISILLKPQLNRLLNIFFGVVYSTIMILIAFTSLTEWRTFYVFLAVVESFITTLIIYYAWTWPKKDASIQTDLH